MWERITLMLRLIWQDVLEAARTVGPGTVLVAILGLSCLFLLVAIQQVGCESAHVLLPLLIAALCLLIIPPVAISEVRRIQLLTVSLLYFASLIATGGTILYMKSPRDLVIQGLSTRPLALLTYWLFHIERSGPCSLAYLTENFLGLMLEASVLTVAAQLLHREMGWAYTLTVLAALLVGGGVSALCDVRGAEGASAAAVASNTLNTILLPWALACSLGALIERARAGEKLTLRHLVILTPIALLLAYWACASIGLWEEAPQEVYCLITRQGCFKRVDGRGINVAGHAGGRLVGLAAGALLLLRIRGADGSGPPTPLQEDGPLRNGQRAP